MKIGWTAFVLDGGRTGIATYILNCLKALSHIDSSNDYRVLIAKGSESLMPPLANNFQLVRYPDVTEHPIVNIAWHNSVLPWHARAEQLDLVHIPSMRRIPLIKGCHVIATIHDMAPFHMPDKYDPARIFYHRQVLSRLVHRCDHIITVSHYTKRDIVRFTGYPEERITVIYSGVDHHLFHPLPRDEALAELHRRYGIIPPFLVYVSRVEHPAKNHLMLIKAFEAFKKKHPNSHRLILAGPDWSGAETVKEYARDSHMADSIHFLGSIPTEDIVRLYSTCDFMAFPSLFEGFGFPLLEAMACRAPVMCSNTTSLGELAKDYAITFDPHDADAIYAAMVAAADHRGGAVAIDRAAAYAATFDWNNTAGEVLKVYQHCLKEGP